MAAAEGDLKVVPESVQRVKENAQKWADLDVGAKIHFLEEILELLKKHSEEWATLQSLGVSKVPPVSSESHDIEMQKFGQVQADSYLTGPGMFAGYMQLLITFLKEYRSTGGKLAAPKFRVAGDDAVVNVLPYGFMQSAAAYGLVGEIYVGRDAQGNPTRGQEFEEEKRPGVVFILGAGNFSAPIEVLTKMFLEHKVSLYKPNPVNQAVTAPMYRRVFAPLIENGYFDVLEGGIEVAQAGINHNDVDQVMITGSDKTYDAIVWGCPRDLEEQKRRKESGQRQLEKQVDAELGNINVVSIVPGNYTTKEISKLTAHLAHVRVINGGHTCPSPQILLMSEGWAQRDQFVEELKKNLRDHLPIGCYYPGTDAKYEQFHSRYENSCEQIEREGGGPPGYKPPLFVSDISSDPELFKTFESFCPVMGVLPIPQSSVDEFCSAATNFVNNEVWGNLATTILCSAETLSKGKERIQRMVDELKMGSVGVNIWGGTCVFFPQMYWGAYPGNTPEDVQSGIGRGVGNFLAYDRMKKGVLWAPYNHDFVTVSASSSLQARKEGQRLTEFNLYQSYWSMIRVVSALYFGW